MAFKQFSTYSSTLLKEIRENLEKATDTHSCTAVHKLRVKIKRLRSLANVLADFNSQLIDTSLDESLKKLFKSAGRLRELHVSEDLLRKCSSNFSIAVYEYYNFLKEKELVSRRKFSDSGRKFEKEFLNKLEKVFSDLFEQVSPVEIETIVGQNCLRTLLKLASRKTGEPLATDKLHSLRIEAKDARYRIHMLLLLRSDLFVLAEVDIWLRTVHQAIGLWHDFTVADLKLDKFLSEDALLSGNSSSPYAILAEHYSELADEAMRTFNDAWTDRDGTLNKSIQILRAIWPSAPIEILSVEMSERVNK